MRAKYFENRKSCNPTERLTFKSEDEFNAFCECIEYRIKLNEEVLGETPEEDNNAHLKDMLIRLKKKKRMTKTEEGEVPVTFINAEDFHLLTMAFIEAVGW